MIIGICGNSGSGKTTLSNKLLNEYDNAVVLHIDEVGHLVLTLDDVKNELVSYFGEDVIFNKNIDRKILGDKVFSSRKEMDKLIDITWKHMKKYIDNFIKENSDKIIILDWILLSTTHYFNLCDIKILVDVPYEERKRRAMLRDNISSDDFDLREKSSVIYDKDMFDIVLSDINDKELRRVLK